MSDQGQDQPAAVERRGPDGQMFRQKKDGTWWWQASDQLWYPQEEHPSYRSGLPPPPSAAPPPAAAAPPSPEEGRAIPGRPKGRRRLLAVLGLGSLGLLVLIAIVSSVVDKEPTITTTGELRNAPTLPPATTARVTDVPLGTTLTVSPGDHQITAHQFESPVASRNQFSTPKAGNQFAAVDVEQCAGPAGDQFGLNPFDFQVAMPDNTRLQPGIVLGREPELHSTPLQAGECVRGWINFEVPIDVAPRYLVYTTGTASARWQL